MRRAFVPWIALPVASSIMVIRLVKMARFDAFAAFSLCIYVEVRFWQSVMYLSSHTVCQYLMATRSRLLTFISVFSFCFIFPFHIDVGVFMVVWAWARRVLSVARCAFVIVPCFQWAILLATMEPILTRRFLQRGVWMTAARLFRMYALAHILILQWEPGRRDGGLGWSLCVDLSLNHASNWSRFQRARAETF